ncbi:glioma pathogenesis-related protein 1 isoform X2 [Dromiciops gliroides]|nr:glioma pathogenesis-related protein 1 isoform X2 [Dromiciops gliroides]
MRRMSWDPHLAKLAKSWAETCPSGHNPRRIHPSFSAVGENIWFGPIFIFFEDAAVKLWYDEFRNFNFETQECAQKKMCLHYTQVVWAHTFKVGCALHYCTKIKGYPSDHGALFICNYAPAGNYFPLKPYMKGKSCAACPSGDTCEDRLCANPKRDTVLAIPSKPTSKPISNLISNPNFNHKESTVKHEENISVVLILLPIFTILSIILAIVIKCYYPRNPV